MKSSHPWARGRLMDEIGKVLGAVLFFCLVVFPGCGWDRVRMGGSLRLGGVISWVADIQIAGGLELETKGVSSDETESMFDFGPGPRGGL